MEKEALLDDDLVARCKNGDRDAFGLLYKRYSKAMYHVCLRMINNEKKQKTCYRILFTRYLQK